MEEISKSKLNLKNSLNLSIHRPSENSLGQTALYSNAHSSVGHSELG